MNRMRSIRWLALCTLLSGCVTPKYGVEQQLTLKTPVQAVWAVAPAINLSGEPQVDPLLQADLLYQQLQSVHNVTVIPVNRVVEVYSALRITKVESEKQAALVCDQLGCDALVIPSVTLFDPYSPPKMGASVQLLLRNGLAHMENVNARDLARRATPSADQSLPPSPNFMQAVGMFDSANGSTHAAVLEYAKGRNDPLGPMGAKEYFADMDRYCGFVYHSLIADLIRQSDEIHRKDQERRDAETAQASKPETIHLADLTGGRE